MGRRIYAEEVGIDKNDTYVHKFWVGVQPSDVSDYLNAYEPNFELADLSIEDEEDIKTKVSELKAQFNKEYDITYEQFTPDNLVGIYDEQNKQKELLASRINLGEHLLQTIENMKDRGIEEQQLTIEF